MTSLWDKMLLRLKALANERGVCVLDVRLLCKDGELLFYKEPKVTRWEPHNDAEAIKAAIMDDDATI